MSDLQKYIEKRKKTDLEFSKNYKEGFEEFKIGLILRQAREKSGLTQEELARKIRTTKSAISRIENHSDDIKLSTLMKVAKALGKSLSIKLF
jgi:DNA-binding XRE family transcriptional regulator